MRPHHPRTWAVVPAKRLRAAKRRLRPLLDAPARAALALAMTRHVLATLAPLRLGGIILVTDDRRLARLATPGIRLVWCPGTPGTTRAVRRGLRTLPAAARRALIIAADLPWLTEPDLRALLARPGIVIATDRAARGTNALTLPRAAFALPRFGPASLHRHRAAATGLPTHVLRRPGLARDVDTPRDLSGTTSKGPRTASRDVRRQTSREITMRRAEIARGLADVAEGRVGDFALDRIVERGRTLLAGRSLQVDRKARS